MVVIGTHIHIYTSPHARADRNLGSDLLHQLLVLLLALVLAQRQLRHLRPQKKQRKKEKKGGKEGKNGGKAVWIMEGAWGRARGREGGVPVNKGKKKRKKGPTEPGPDRVERGPKPFQKEDPKGL